MLPLHQQLSICACASRLYPVRWLQVLMGRNSSAKLGDLGVAQEIPEGTLTVELPDLVGTFAWTVRLSRSRP